MHPEHTQAFQDTAPSTEPIPTPQIFTAQHGIHSLPTAIPSPSDLSHGVGEGGVRRIDDGLGSHGGAGDTGMSVNGISPEDETLPRDDGNITSPSKKKDVVSQYEARGVSPPGDTRFHVKKTNWQGRLDSPISRFPNEILIYSLSFLDPRTLLTASLISRRFHSLIASSHAWQSAFSRYFPSTSPDRASSDPHGLAAFSSSYDRRFFTRLSAGGSDGNLWRKEYTLRTRLLRNLAKGKSGVHSQGRSIITYHTLINPESVSHIAAGFSPRGARLLHASVDTGIVTASNATIGRIERPLTNAQFGAAIGPDIHQAILGVAGFEVATDMGAAGVMDLSEDVGWVYGENVAYGKCYVHPYSSPYRTGAERGFFLRGDQVAATCLQPAITAVWIAKKRSGGVLETSEGQVGVMIGNSRGFVSIYGLSFGKECQVTPTKMFCVCPGIPIVSIKVDEDYSVKRKRQNNIWAVIVNALGEIYCLTDPKIGWEIIPQTTRIPSIVHSVVFVPSAEITTEEESKRKKREDKELLLNTEYTRLKLLWEGWGMDWFVELDWAGASIVLGRKNADRRSTRDEQTARLTRYHLLSHAPDAEAEGLVREAVTDVLKTGAGAAPVSVFGGDARPLTTEQKAKTIEPLTQPTQLGQFSAKWAVTDFLFGDKIAGSVTASAIDNSNLALLSPSDDLGITSDVPGGNARLFAVGTSMGDVYVWNIRHPVSSTNDEGRPPVGVFPQRVIRTDSPRISALALSSLYLVHGGNDGLVQAWDLLSSTYSPLRNIHSRLPTRARPRLAQADAAATIPADDSLGENQIAARCLVLDPDPTLLRGAVALGTQIRYWCLSSPSGLDNSKRWKKTRIGGKSRWTPTRAREEIEGVIRSDSWHLTKERELERKQKEELEKRYGISSGRAALNDEEMLEYARIISMETYEIESGGSIASGDSSRTITPEGSSRATSSHGTTEEFKDAEEEVEDLELAQALRMSLEDSTGGDPGIVGDALDSEVWEDADEYPGSGLPLSPVIAGPSHRGVLISNRSPPSEFAEASEWPSVSGAMEKGKGRAQHSTAMTEEEELGLAIKLSLMEEQERRGIMDALDDDDWSQVVGKGKGKW